MKDRCVPSKTLINVKQMLFLLISIRNHAVSNMTMLYMPTTCLHRRPVSLGCLFVLDQWVMTGDGIQNMGMRLILCPGLLIATFRSVVHWPRSSFLSPHFYGPKISLGPHNILIVQR